MSDMKGKGRAIDPSEAGKRSSDPSLLSRVAASATGLTRNAFAAPTSNELNDRAAAALANSGKGQSSGSSGSAAWAESSKTTTQHSNGQVSSGSAFRAGHHEEHVRQSKNEFSEFLDVIDSFAPSENETPFASGGLGTGDGLEQAWSRSQPTSRATLEAPFKSVAEQESRDGEEVLAILSQPGMAEGAFEAPQEDENYDWGLSREQLSQLRAMTKDLFPPMEVHGNIHADHPLNLAPNFDGAYGHDPAAIEDIREQWDGVLSGYTDEVWGGLLPLVQEARREMDDLRNDLSSTEQPKALRRLGAILGHLRQY